MSQEELNDETAALESALASFCPRPSRVDRDRVMFLAGRASAAGKPSPFTPDGRSWAWPGAFTAMTALAATLLVLLLVEPDLPVGRGTTPAAVRTIDDRTPAPDRDAGSWPPESERGRPWLERTQPPLQPRAPYYRQLDRILAMGPESWAAMPPSAAPGDQPAVPSVPYRQQLMNTLPELPATGEPPSGRPAPGSLFKPGANS